MLIEIAGWAGSLMMLTAYGLLSIGRLRANSVIYQAMNVAAALGVAVNSWMHGALPSVFASSIWTAIGAFALVRLLRSEGTS